MRVRTPEKEKNGRNDPYDVLLCSEVLPLSPHRACCRANRGTAASVKIAFSYLFTDRIGGSRIHPVALFRIKPEKKMEKNRKIDPRTHRPYPLVELSRLNRDAGAVARVVAKVESFNRREREGPRGPGHDRTGRSRRKGCVRRHDHRTHERQYRASVWHCLRP